MNTTVETRGDQRRPRRTTQAVGKGVRAVGKRAEETKDAFSGFKEEYDKARGAKGSDGGTSTVVKEGLFREAVLQNRIRQEGSGEEEHVRRVQGRVRQGAPWR